MKNIDLCEAMRDAARAVVLAFFLSLIFGLVVAIVLVWSFA
jgi:hypothetical protein